MIKMAVMPIPGKVSTQEVDISITINVLHVSRDMRKPDFQLAKTTAQSNCVVTPQLASVFVSLHG